MLRRSFVLGLLMAGMMGNVLAIEIPQDQVPEVKCTENGKYLTPKEAHQFIT